MTGKLQVVAAVAGALAFPGSALGATTAGAEYDFGLSAVTASTPTGLSLRVVYRDPYRPAAKPPPLEAVRIDLPAGLRIDTAALPACGASDEELRLFGRAACPPASRVGTGTLTAETGIPTVGPVRTDLTVFNGHEQLIELVSFRGTNVTAGSDRLRLVGQSLVADPPAVPGGPPDGRTTVREIAFRLPGRSGVSGRPYITTPPSCPSGGAWDSRLVVKFETYPAPVSVTDPTPCRGGGASTAKPRLRVSIRPRRALAGRRTRFRIRVRSKSADCRRQVRVRLGGRRVRTNGRGRARIAVRFRASGRRIVRAAKRGCRGDRARVRIR